MFHAYAYRARQEAGTAYEGTHDTLDDATVWTLHLPVADDDAVPAVLDTLAAAGGEALTGDYLVEPSFAAWGEPEPQDDEDQKHLAVYFHAATAERANRTGEALALAVDVKDWTVSTAGDWAEQTWRLAGAA